MGGHDRAGGERKKMINKEKIQQFRKARMFPVYFATGWTLLTLAIVGAVIQFAK